MVKPFYFFNVVFYTADDFKQGFPPYLILAGLFVHAAVILILIDRKRRLKFSGLRRLVEKVLPFVLLLIYSWSYYVAKERGLNEDGLPIYIVTFIPVFLYLILIGHHVKWLNFLRDKRWIYNYGFLAVFVLLYVFIRMRG